MSGTMMIDPAGRVTRLHEVKTRNEDKISPSFTPSLREYNGGLFCHRDVKHPSQRQLGEKKKRKKKKKRKNEPVSFSSFGTILPRVPASIEKSTPRNKKPTLVVKESTGKSGSKNSLLTKPHALPAAGNEENQPPLSSCSYKNRPWNKRRLSRGDSQNTASTSLDQSARSLRTHSSMLDKYAFMSYRFPISTKTKKVVLTKKPNSRDITFDNGHGEMIGCVDYSFVKQHKTRILKDVTGKPCAVIQERITMTCGRPTRRFRVYGDKPAFFGQEPEPIEKVVKGCYLWAEIKNMGSVGGTFMMKRYSSETSFETHLAKRFGSLFSTDKSKGYTILDDEEKECVRMFSLKNNAKGILIAPDRDMCLMLAFCAVVDEMVKNLLL